MQDRPSRRLDLTLVCCRYMRGMRLRWPLRHITNSRPIDLINFELKAALLAAGYAVVTIDVRGTGLGNTCRNTEQAKPGMPCLVERVIMLAC